MKKFILLFVICFISNSFFAKNDTLSIINHTDKDAIFPKNLKVVYRGIYNYLSIEVPNCKSFTAKGIGLNFVSGNLYCISPGTGNEVLINIEIVLMKDKKLIENHIFKIRNIPHPISTINNLNGNLIKLQKSNLQNAIIRVESGDENLNFNFKVIGFSVKINGKSNIKIFGNHINNAIFQIINKNCAKYDQITINDIYLEHQLDTGCFIETSPILIELL